MNVEASKALRAALIRMVSHGPIAIVEHNETPWASVTFSGTRHRLALRFGLVEVADSFADDLPRTEFKIAGQLIADAAVINIARKFEPRQEVTMVVEVLALDDKKGV